MKEVVVIGSAGIWSKGKDLDDAFTKAQKFGPLGKQIVVAVCPAEAEATVDGSGSLCWRGEEPPAYAKTEKGGRTWPNRRSAALRAAVAVLCCPSG